MDKLTNQSTLHTWIQTINELIDGWTNALPALDNLRNIESTVSDADYTAGELSQSVLYHVKTAGVYRVEVKDAVAEAERLEVYINHNRKKNSFRFTLSKDSVTLKDLFLNVGDTMVLKGDHLSSTTKASITFEQNLIQYTSHIAEQIDDLNVAFKQIDALKEEYSNLVEEIKPLHQAYIDGIKAINRSQEDIQKLYTLIGQ